MKTLLATALALAALLSGGCSPLHIQRAAFSPLAPSNMGAAP